MLKKTHNVRGLLETQIQYKSMGYENERTTLAFTIVSNFLLYPC